jgi:hypothetical protein
LLAGGGWFFFLNKPASQDANNTPAPTPEGGASPLPNAPASRPAPPVAAPSFALPASVNGASSINGATPDAGNYPYKRQLYYAYKNPPSQTVKDFLGYATSPEGQKAMLAEN